MAQRLIDQFRDELRDRGLESPGEIEVCGVFGDLLWPPFGDREHVLSRLTEDPAFTVEGYSRYVALARLVGELRCYAGAITAGAPSWWWSGEDPERVAAVEAESDDQEIVVFATVADALAFTIAYLGGASLRDIAVPRTGPRTFYTR